MTSRIQSFSALLGFYKNKFYKNKYYRYQLKMSLSKSMSSQNSPINNQLRRFIYARMLSAVCICLSETTSKLIYKKSVHYWSRAPSSNAGYVTSNELVGI